MRLCCVASNRRLQKSSEAEALSEERLHFPVSYDLRLVTETQTPSRNTAPEKLLLATWVRVKRVRMPCRTALQSPSWQLNNPAVVRSRTPQQSLMWLRPALCKGRGWPSAVSVGMQSHWVPGHAENLVTGHHIAENKNPHAMLLSRPQPAGISRSCMLHAGSVKTSSLKALAELHDIMQPFTDPEQLFNLF